MLILPLGGCAKEAIILLQAFLNTTTGSVATVDNDSWVNKSQTPTDIAATAVAIGLKSATLTGPSAASFPIFEWDADDPQVLIQPSTDPDTPTFIGSKGDVADGTYDTLALEIIFVEAAVRVHTTDTDSEVRRMRVYLLDDYVEKLTSQSTIVKKYDVMMSEGPFNPADPDNTGKNMRWIRKTDGSLCASSTRANCTTIYQVPATQFPNYPTVTVTLPSGKEIEVASDTDKQFVVTLEAAIRDLFFFDETDGNNFFNYLSDLATSADGKIEAGCVTDCTDNDEADFWLVPPTLTISDVTTN